MILMRYFFSFLLVIFYLEGTGQTNPNDTLIYLDGDKAFNRMLSKEIDLSEYTDSIHPDTYCNVDITVDRNGKVRKMDLFILGDSVLSKIFYNALMHSDGKWSKSSKNDRVFNILFYYHYSEDGDEKKIPVTNYSYHFEPEHSKKITNYGTYKIIAFPTVR